MGWTEEAARSLVATFAGAFDGAEAAFAAAAVDATGRSVYASPGVAPDRDRFEIGSVTKTMTGTLLAMLVTEGTLGLGDEVGRWLAAGENSGITLRELATHTSGLPRLAPGHAGRDPANPYAGFTGERAEEALRGAVRDPAAGYAYSNFGYQLLGMVLERACGSPYGTLLTGRLLEPLAMTCSGVGTAGGGTPLPGHARGEPAPRWEQPLPASGAVETTIADLARYVAACLRPEDGPLGPAVTPATTPCVDAGGGNRQALGWHVRGDGVLWHDGDTGGFASAVAIDPARRRGVAVLAGTSDAAGALEQAAFLAVAGRDPGAARPRRPAPEWADRARAVTGSLLDRRHDDLHARMAPELRSRVSAAQLERLWWMHTLGAGPAGDVSVATRRVGRRIGADVTIAFARRRLEMSLSFDGSGRIADLRFRRAG